jgi:hypothetical protein
LIQSIRVPLGQKLQFSKYSQQAAKKKALTLLKIKATFPATEVLTLD